MITELLNGISSLTMSSEDVTKDILLLKFKIVNACMVGNADNKNSKWVLVDTGLENSAEFIVEEAEKRFGHGASPAAIILTHGHFDHVGSVLELLKFWKVPVYAHELELPYLTGRKDYPQGDPTVDGGMVSELSPNFPHHAIDLGDRIKPLPGDGSIPEMHEWRYINTPGHTPGHISLFRDSDRVLIVADAFCTLKQESMTNVLTQSERISGPPKYMTTDWAAAEESVKRLRDLHPSLAIVSHGSPISGRELKRHLDMLVDGFDRIAVPEHGRFVE